jgi:non-ribosomal peptide synthase protein (TIGR01720 family)
MGETAVLIHLEGHGREDLFADVDVSRTIGWFTALYPVQLDLAGIEQPGAAIMAVKEQLRQLPRRGIGYGLLRYANRDKAIADLMQKLPQPEVSFNYLGQMDQVAAGTSPFGPAPESKGAERHQQAQRTHVLEIDGGMMGNRLELAWSYSTQIHRRDTIARLAESYIEALRALIIHCQSPAAGGITLSDVSDFGWQQDDLDDILSAIEQI